MMHPRICADADDGSSHVALTLLHPRRGTFLPIHRAITSDADLWQSFPLLSHKSKARDHPQ